MQPDIPIVLYYSFLILVLTVIVLCSRELRRVFPGKKIYVYGLTLWFFLQYTAGKFGFFSSGLGQIPPKIMLIVIPNFLFLLYLAFSKSGEAIAKEFDLRFLTVMQSFRIFVELILWQLADRQLLPTVMSFEGRNFDIIIGLTAPVVGYLYTKGMMNKMGLILWNIAGLVLVTNVVVHGILSVPGIELIQTNVPNFIISYSPFNLLPGVLVPIAYLFHICSLKKLLKAE